LCVATVTCVLFSQWWRPQPPPAAVVGKSLARFLGIFGVNSPSRRRPNRPNYNLRFFYFVWTTHFNTSPSQTCSQRKTAAPQLLVPSVSDGSKEYANPHSEGPASRPCINPEANGSTSALANGLATIVRRGKLHICVNLVQRKLSKIHLLIRIGTSDRYDDIAERIANLTPVA
jgi:hypothetical protein